MKTIVRRKEELDWSHIERREYAEGGHGEKNGGEERTSLCTFNLIATNKLVYSPRTNTLTLVHWNKGK